MEEAARHTVGPWDAGKAYKGSNNSYFAAVFSPSKNGRHHTPRAAEALGVDKKEAEANARLIAAAPDLLAALKALYAECAMIHKYGGEGCNQKQADAAISAGLAAIAKAEAQ